MKVFMAIGANIGADGKAVVTDVDGKPVDVAPQTFEQTHGIAITTPPAEAFAPAEAPTSPQGLQGPQVTRHALGGPTGFQCDCGASLSWPPEDMIQRKSRRIPANRVMRCPRCRRAHVR